MKKKRIVSGLLVVGGFAAVLALLLSAPPSSGAAPAVGLALEIDGGAGVPLKVRAGQEFFINQIDIRASLEATVDEGVAGLTASGDFASLPWQGVELADQEPAGLPNGDGSWMLRRFYRGAAWMERPSLFVVTPVDAGGRATGVPIPLHIGADDRRVPSDDFFVRRLRAIQWIFDCPSKEDCSGASAFEEEALVEVRNARGSRRTFTLSPDTAALEVRWSLKNREPYLIPVEQVENPSFDYGFGIAVEALTPPAPDGTYAPGTDITFQLTLTDGAGQRLHPQGELPPYAEVALAEHPAGIQYYRAFFDPTTTYYRRKHQERMLMVQIIGPAQNIQPVRSIIELADFLGPADTQVVARPERDDGIYSEFQTFPPSNDLFGGAFDPTRAGWFAPVSDTFTFHLPDNAQPGTYLVTVKGRRTYLGEDVAATTTIEIQVGTPERTVATLGTGPCTSCHSNGGELSNVLHANDNRAACAGCHVPLAFELEGPIPVRVHFIHSRSDRLGAPLDHCASCHLTAESIQRTSQAACLSCHKSYPEDHVETYGPIESMYIGGGRESFQQCTDACHTTHPGSGL